MNADKRGLAFNSNETIQVRKSRGREGWFTRPGLATLNLRPRGFLQNQLNSTQPGRG